MVNSDASNRALATRAPLGPNSFIFMRFSEKMLLNNRLVHPLRSWRPIPGKFWIRHWLTFCKMTEMLLFLLISQYHSQRISVKFANASTVYLLINTDVQIHHKLPLCLN